MLTDIEYYTLRRRLALRKVAGFAACRPYRLIIHGASVEDNSWFVNVLVVTCMGHSVWRKFGAKGRHPAHITSAFRAIASYTNILE